jgi:hypothetical protein
VQSIRRSMAAGCCPGWDAAGESLSPYSLCCVCPAAGSSGIRLVTFGAAWAAPQHAQSQETAPQEGRHGSGTGGSSKPSGGAAPRKAAQARPAAVCLAGEHLLTIRHQLAAALWQRLLVLLAGAVVGAHRRAVLTPAAQQEAGSRQGGAVGFYKLSKPAIAAAACTTGGLLASKQLQRPAASGSTPTRPPTRLPTTHLRSRPNALWAGTQQSSWHSCAGGWVFMCALTRCACCVISSKVECSGSTPAGEGKGSGCSSQACQAGRAWRAALQAWV